MKRNGSILCAGFLMIASIAQATVSRADWGKTPDGQSISIFTLTDRDLTVRITNFGARIVSIEAPDRDGKRADVVLGYDKASQYIADKSTYFGAVVGRYGNRIAKGTFSIDGQVFHVPINDKTNALHGGTVGFDQKIWTGRELHDGVEMTLLSPDGDMGFPGALTVHVRYTLEGKSLHISYKASSTRATVVNLTNHSYFNLAGSGNRTVLDQALTIPADRYTPVDTGLIPTSELAPVTQTPFDFHTATTIGTHINTPNEQLKRAGGYDHNFVLNGTAGKFHLAAHILDPSSGRTLTVSTTEPGLQFYSGNFLDGTKTGKFGITYGKHAGFCLETQHFPDSPNEPSFPSTLLKLGQTFQSETIFTFDVQH